MSETLHQRIQDSENTYLNTSFWEIHPLFVLIQSGESEHLEEKLHIQLERFPAGRITRDERKQLEYLTVSLVNTFMIAAIQGGVYPPEANAAADQALRQLSHLRNTAELPALVHDAAAKLCIMVREAKRQDTGNPHVEKAKQYLASHLTLEISAEDVAWDVCLSVSHLSRLFKSLTGKTMMEYLIDERIEAARQLLVTTDRSIPQIASLMRFCDQSYFTLVFRQKTGQTPAQYRAGHQRYR